MSNPERDQDRVFDTTDHFNKFGYVMFPQNKRTYENLGEHIEGSILEAGCGMGLGAYILGGVDLATDKLERNVRFARELYPDINFDVWDISKSPWKKKYDTVVCVEAIEHVTDVRGALENLIASAKQHMWFSTPNNKEETPSNPFHTREFTREEILEMLKGYEVEVHHWDSFERIEEETDVSPLIYHIIL